MGTEIQELPFQENETQGGAISVRVAAGSAFLNATLSIPLRARGLIMIPYCGVDNDQDSFGECVARLLQLRDFATLELDLLTATEQAVDRQLGHLRCDIELLAERLVGTTDWLGQYPEAWHLRIGYFGWGIIAGAVMAASLKRPGSISAIVACSGRTELIEPFLPLVKTPTLFMVGSDEPELLAMNRHAQRQIRGITRFEALPQAVRTDTEPEVLDLAIQHASDWFARYLV